MLTKMAYADSYGQDIINLNNERRERRIIQ